MEACVVSPSNSILLTCTFAAGARRAASSSGTTSYIPYAVGPSGMGQVVVRAIKAAPGAASEAAAAVRVKILGARNALDPDRQHDSHLGDTR